MRRLAPLLLFALVGCGPFTSDNPPPPTQSPSGTLPPTKPVPPPTRPQEPCHPGCFPAGTPVLTPAGVREVQTVKAGETVTLIAADGTATSGKVESVFETCNKLLDLRTDAGTLRTTETQPLCLAAGGFVEAGKLKAGDRIWTWADGKRAETTVKDITPVEGTSAVFNLVVGEGKVFVAGGFLARGKPPVK